MSERHRKLAEAARALNAAHPADSRLPALFFFTDEHRTPDPLAAMARLPDRCGIVFRHYGAKDRMNLAREVGITCRMQARWLLLGGVTKIPHGVDASGIHLPTHMLRTLTELPLTRFVTAAAHNEDELRKAEMLGVNAVFLSPVFATASHPDAPALGVERFAALVAATHLPVYALGGVTDDTVDDLKGSGACGIAAIDGLL